MEIVGGEVVEPMFAAGVWGWLPDTEDRLEKKRWMALRIYKMMEERVVERMTHEQCHARTVMGWSLRCDTGRQVVRDKFYIMSMARWIL